MVVIMVWLVIVLHRVVTQHFYHRLANTWIIRIYFQYLYYSEPKGGRIS